MCTVCFTEQRCLLAAMELYNHKLTKEEKARNRHTECAVYSYDKEIDFMYPSILPQQFPDIVHCHVRYKHTHTHRALMCDSQLIQYFCTDSIFINHITCHTSVM